MKRATALFREFDATEGGGGLKFVFRQWIDAPREAVFAFFRNPRCLAMLHVTEKHIRVLRHASDVRIGAETWAEVTALGIWRVVLGFRHDVFEAPAKFGESQIHGPFKKFKHTHEFRECARGTQVVDYLEVALPWYYGGKWAVRWLVWPRMERSFAIRHHELSELAASGELERIAEENSGLWEVSR